MPKITEQTTLGQLQVELSKHGVVHARACTFHNETNPVWVSLDNHTHYVLGRGATLAEAFCQALDSLVARVAQTITECERSTP